MLSTKTASVLNILVNQYVQTAVPVASEDIARLSRTKVSSSTVRNAMSQLTEEGYISRPHVSAGGIPSDLGYRHYLESIEEVPELPAEERRRIHHTLDRADLDGDAWSRQCATILSGITANLSIVTVPRSIPPRVKQIQLVYLTECLALLIVVLQEARLLRRLLPLEGSVAANELDRSASKLNEYLGGLSHTEIESNSLELSSLEERVKRDTSDMMREAESGGLLDHHMDGLRLLLNQPEFSQSNRARELVEMSEERVLVEGVLSETPDANELAIYIGGENRHEALRSFGVILCRYGMPNHVGGTICVVGPTRMDYAEAISGVRYLSSVMSRLVVDVLGAGYVDHADHSSMSANGEI